MHDNTVLCIDKLDIDPNIFIVKRVGDDHSPEAVEIEEHTPPKFQIYTKYTYLYAVVWC